MDLHKVIDKAGELLNRPASQLHFAATGGGGTAVSGRLSWHDGAGFLKYHRQAALLQAEARSLELISPWLRSPAVLGQSELANGGLLLLEWLPLDGLAGERALRRAGQALARLHSVRSDYYGAGADNFIGGMPQKNGWWSNWQHFFAEQRLRPQLQWARENGLPAPLCQDVSRVIDQLARWLPDQPPASLLHGDLWQGNLAAIGEQPVFYDPACYYGDPQIDLAMLNLFGDIPGPLLDAYAQTQGEGWQPDRQRWRVYDLYHWLNHFNLFGAMYQSAIRDGCRQLL